MMKKAVSLLAVCLLLFGFGLTALAEEADAPDGNGGALYGDYEDEWFDNGYDGIENEPITEEELSPQQPWLYRLSIVPVLLGAAVGAAAVAFLSRRSRPDMPSAAPYELQPNTHVKGEYDRLADVTQTTRALE